VNIEDFRDYCLTKLDASESTPFGEDTLVFKVGGKIFAIASLDDVPARVNLKCDPERALDLRDRYEEVQPGYHMNKKHWNTIALGGRLPNAELRALIDHSYELVAGNQRRRKRK
jgi:predicted DNA-binding protein (MmcQ/YjbR family)